MEAPLVSSSDRNGRTLVVAFDGTNNRFNDTVGPTSPTATIKALNFFHDSASSNPWIEHKRGQVLLCSRSSISSATIRELEPHSPQAQKLDDPDKQMVFYQVRWLQ
jgi:hypothetical protein